MTVISITTRTSNVVVKTTQVTTVKVVTPGPQGPKGDTGPQGAPGKSPVPYVIALS